MSLGIDGPDWDYVATFRDLDYGWESCAENIVDPSHVPVSHHGVNGGALGNRTDARPLPLRVTEWGAGGFSGELEGKNPVELSFRPPSRISYVFPGRKIISTYLTPTGQWVSFLDYLVGFKEFFLTQLLENVEL